MKRLIHIGLLAIAITSCSGGNGSGSAANNGVLSFQDSQYKVSQNSTTELKLTLSKSTAASNTTVYLQSSNPEIATVINSVCTLRDESGFNNSCEVKVRGNNTGNAIITAVSSTAVSASTSLAVTQNNVITGLTFEPSAESVTIGQDTKVMLKLLSGSNINNLTVNLASSDSNIARLEQKSCTFNSSEKVCEVTINGISLGNAQIIATSAEYNLRATNTVNVTNESQPGNIVISAVNSQLSPGETEEATVNLVGSSGVSSFTVNLSEENSNVAISQANTCVLSSLRPKCILLVTGKTIGTDTVTASANGYKQAGMIFNVSNTVVKGHLSFGSSSESVVFGDTTDVKLYYDGGQGVRNLPVSITSSNNNISVSPTTCVFDSKFPHNVCIIRITGRAIGKSTITASASGYDSVTNQVTILPSSVVVKGNLIFVPSNITVKTNSTYPMKLFLENSSNVHNLTVPITVNNGSVTVTPNTCTLSTEQKSCDITVRGVTAGNSIISTNVSGYQSAAAQVTVTNKNLQAQLVFDQSSMGLPASTDSSRGQIVATLRLINGDLTPITVTLPGTGVNPAFSFAYYYDVASCIMSSESPVCYMKVVNQLLAPNQTIGASASFQASATGGDETILPAAFTATVRNIIPVARTIKVINSCSYDSYPEIAGAANQNTSNCPNGSSMNAGSCQWSNPIPINKFNTNNPYKISTGQYLTFEIPAGQGMDKVGSVWNGALTNRRIESGYYIYGDCTGNPVVSSANESCPFGRSPTNPFTGYEVTFLGNGPTSSDIQNIQGLMQPASMTPTPYEPLTNNTSGYQNGIPGGTLAQPGTQYALPAATWDANLADAIAAGWPQESTVLFNYVIPPNATDTTSNCSQQNPTCPTGQVCGYSPWTINQNFVPGLNVSYSLICGKRIGYLTLASLTAISNSNSNIPLPFNVTYSGSNWSMSALYNPAAGGPNTGYGGATPDADTAGCTNWTGITAPAEQCGSSNPAWVNYVLPGVKWIKQACPTCYSYQYDDQASTFTNFVLHQTNTSNPTPNDGITIELCPEGKEIH
ncbi:MAG: hypothetical protein E6Q32_00830 [Neisseriales bacterium]|nr:MAG: hypothetical protein E6Q32_00830 [Neisseriales bacterium]